LFHNLMTLTSWTYDMRAPAPDLGGQLSTTAWHTGLPLLLGLAVIAALAWRATPLPGAGLAWFALTLAPVLPLLHQRYMHYLYAPLAGLAVAIGAGAEWLLLGLAPRRGRPATRATVAWALVAAAIAAYVTASDALIVERAAGRIASVGLPSDPFMRKMEM